MNLFNNNTLQHENTLNLEFQKILKDIREFTKNLGENVIEDIRPHRIVYSKGIVFRSFLDIQPLNDKIVIVVKKNRDKKEQYTIKTVDENIDYIKKEINDAYVNIK